MPYRLIRTVGGRRGGILVLLGIGYVLIGVTNCIAPISSTVDLAFSWLPGPLTSKVLGVIWICVGLGVLLVGITSSKYSKLENTAFGIASFPPFVAAFIFSASTFFGNPYGWSSAAVYVLVSTLVLYIAGWANPVVLKKRVSDAST